MTHIISKPSDPMRRVTFADVPVGATVETGSRQTFVRTPVFECDGGQWNAVDVHGCRPVWVGDDTPATLLTQPTPVEPEPDPAVTTYGDLKPGEWFAFRVTPESLCQRTDEGHVYEGIAVPGMDPKMPVRRAPASLVVHEEPGSLGGGFKLDAFPKAARIFGPGGAMAILSPEQAERLTQQLAGWLHALAQCDAKPDTPAEPAEDRTKLAPGYTMRLVGDRWILERPGTSFFLKDSSKTFLIRRSWRGPGNRSTPDQAREEQAE